jgi:hypothetical protein
MGRERAARAIRMGSDNDAEMLAQVMRFLAAYVIAIREGRGLGAPSRMASEQGAAACDSHYGRLLPLAWFST